MDFDGVSDKFNELTDQEKRFSIELMQFPYSVILPETLQDEFKLKILKKLYQKHSLTELEQMFPNI